MRKFLAFIAVAALLVCLTGEVFAQFPYWAYNPGYLMQDGQKAVEQNTASMANWWGCKRGKITDTCPITISTKYGDSIWLFKISNYSGTDILFKFLGDNNHSDTIPITVQKWNETGKLPKIWKLISTSVTSSTLDSTVLWFQHAKKMSNDL
jgi:hypothetical protein